ncbi:hypothetical protein P4493_05830 [Bacillus thuringiensis]|jgi:hypothetical protein|uniref:Uncharacterized protein n=3 Tax=Bacillus thuringiensis TaxID=1428 RepID=A0A0B5NPT9_BACTU|nr:MULTISPECIES: hypothetical protein [Bacillus]MEC2533082.1 hypothetical protein [Bacillus cereus]MED1153938.1 hypothetical protein [Bacillus paranthracis]OUB09222.1 hypothetical protein BK708_32315 [Bacillus thuringiensis serovar yunnanensis]AFQ29810.1 hypothetical protein BTF1_28547 [Bacillus thuringiensis HD-789]AJG74113.1 hypothetical protein BF38_6054 [Bacillus thuringiensis]
MLGTNKGYDYISQVSEAVNKIEEYIIKGSGERLVEAMKKRQAIFESKELSTLRKLRQITSWRDYDLTEYSYGQKDLLELHKLALKHTIYLINSILKFEEVTKNGSNLDYSRTVDGFRADMRINEKGFILSIRNGEKTILNTIVGSSELIHARGWYETTKEVRENVDFGLWIENFGTSSDMFESVYKVNPNNIEPIKARIRKEFVANGLMTQVRAGGGWTVGNQHICKSSSATHDDIICIHTMYYGLHYSEIQLALDIVNAVIKEEGYSTKFER